MMTVNLKDVEITQETLDGQARWVVTPVWDGVDRQRSGSYSTGSNRKLADRLAAAFKAGKAYKNLEKREDVNHKTYASYNFQILMRHANADLKRLGF